MLSNEPKITQPEAAEQDLNSGSLSLESIILTMTVPGKVDGLVEVFN